MTTFKKGRLYACRSVFVSSISLLSIALYTTAAVAQDAGIGGTSAAATSSTSEANTAAQPTGQGRRQDLGSADIVVTARRRAENLEKVPAAITAFNGEQLAQHNILSQSDLQLSVPGLTIRQTEGQNQLNYSIRGQTLDQFTGSPSAVVAYIDEVQLNSGGASSFFDLASIQVLKGPQGTLFGRNATGGAVLYVTAKPTNDFGGYIEGRFGNMSKKEGQGAVNLPIVNDKILLRLAFDVDSRDGYVYDLYHDKYLGATRRQSGRASLTLKPTDSLTNTTVFEYDHAGGNNTGATYFYSLNQCGTSNNGFALACSVAALYNPESVDATFGPGAWAAYLAAHPKAFALGVNAYLEQQRRQGYWVTDSQNDSVHREHDWFVVNTTSYELGGQTTLKNIFGASRSYTFDDAPETGLPYAPVLTENIPLGEYGQSTAVSQISNELQLQGKSLGDNLTYIVGGYFQHSHTTQYSPQTYFDLLPFTITGVDSIYRLTDRTEAVYAQGTYDMGSLTGASGLSFTGGIRYSWEQVGLDQLPGSQSYPAPHQKVSFQDPSWEAGFEYQANRQFLMYIKTRGSFRAGGLNGFAPPVNADASGAGDVFRSEHTHDVEAGLKYAGHLFDKPAHFNIAIYNQWISGVQRVELPIVDGHSVAVTVNVPAAIVRGVEAESAVRLASWFEVGASGAYTHARYTDNQLLIFGQTFVYGPFADTPKLSGSVYGQFTVPVGTRDSDLNLRIDAYAQTAQYFSNINGSRAPGTKLPGYAIVNGRLDWNKVADTNLSVGLFAKNMLNQGYFTGGLSQGGSLGSNSADVGEPRTFGIDAKYRF